MVAEVLQGLQLLVVDPSEDNCALLRLVLELAEAEVYTAQTQEQALNALMQCQLDLMIVELVMPGADGYALLRQIQQLEPIQGGKAIAIAMTADMMQSEAKAIAAGFAKLLRKPFDVTALGPMLAELICVEEGLSIKLSECNRYFSTL